LNKDSKETSINNKQIAQSFQESLETEENQRFSLRKRRQINYNFKTKMFEYDRDSDYEEKPKKRTKKKYFYL